MIVKRSSHSRPFISIVLALWQNRKRRLITIAFAIVATFGLTGIGVCAIFEHRRNVYAHFLKPTVELLRSRPYMIPHHMASGLLANPEHIIIDLKHKHFMKLGYQRDVALAQGHLDSGQDAFVPATIEHNGKAVRVDMRLKGDWTDHLLGDKWSFRIKVNGDDTLFGMTQFSLQHPATRNYIYEWLYHKALAREGVISLRYDFITATLNGKHLGVYAVEEHCEKRLIEHNRLREGPILRFNEGLLWAERFQQQKRFPESERNGVGDYLSSPIDGFQLNRQLATATSTSLYNKAIYLLESFRRGMLSTSEVFDTAKLAKYFAMADLMGAKHSTMWQNTRFYYNPVTSRLEPVPFDANCGKPTISLNGTINTLDLGSPSVVLSESRSGFFRDQYFFREYVSTLERVSESDYLDALLGTVDDELQKRLRIIYSEFPSYQFDSDVLYRNQRYIRSVLHPVKGLHAYVASRSDTDVTVEIGNIHGLPLEVLGISNSKMHLPVGSEPRILPAKRKSDPVAFTRVHFELPDGMNWTDDLVSSLRVEYRVLGSRSNRRESIFPWSYLGDNSGTSDFIRQRPNADTFDFMVVDTSTQEIIVSPGTWTLERSLIIPAGYTVRCIGATRFDLTNSARIMSYSPMQFHGGEDSPIMIESSDGTGQGLIVQAAGSKSGFTHVTFRNLTNPSQSGWQLTGAITFYESPVEFTHCRFIGNSCEDALNTIRSSFLIQDSVFSNTEGDAFDADFCHGTLRNVSFFNLGNDGIDVSGSEIRVENVLIDRAGDKGLSSGEGSRTTVDRLDVRNSEIGVASKDVSELTIDNLTVSQCRIGITSYQKKPEFGAASVTADRVSMSNVEVPYLIEDKSHVVVNGKRQEASRENVKAMLYGAQYGKASR